MRKFAIRVLIFLSIFFVYDKLFYFVASRSADAEIDKRLENIIQGKVNYDIIITGSSTGSRDIIASQIENYTGLSTYNLCYPGSNVEFHEFLLRTLLTYNKKPKIVLLMVDDDAELFYDKTISFRLDCLYPLVKYPYIRTELINRGVKDKLISKFLILHQINKANFDLRKKVFTPIDTIQNCGSMPISWQKRGWDVPYLTEVRDYPIDTELVEKRNAFREIVRLCDSNNIQLINVFPPVYQSHSKLFEARIRQMGSENTSYYVYDLDNPVYQNEDYYYDESHLMSNGALIFTNELIQFLNNFVREEL